MEDKKTKKMSVLMIITIAIFVLTIGGATYAYLINQNYGKETEGSIESITYTTDSLTFNTSGDISVRANTENFAPDAGNLSATATTSATLLANNKTNIATMYYRISININENDYEYSTSEQYPELLLQVTDSEGNAITSINGLSYVTYKEGTEQEISGFDVTTKKGKYFLTPGYPITVDEANTDHLTTQEWKIKVTLVNLDSDQEVNARKVFDTDVYIEKSIHFSEYLKTEVYRNDSTFLLHNSSLVNGAGDNSYRYSGPSASVNNWVCFGTDATTCPADNLYRIIGMFDDNKDGKYEVKLIKNTSIGNVKWGSNNTYSSSNVRSTVNGSYLSGLGTIWKNMILTHTWKVGGLEMRNRSHTAKSAYNYELGANSLGTTSTDKVGLMYISDYLYAVSSGYWITKHNDYSDIKESNWLNPSAHEWTIARYNGSSGFSHYITEYGQIVYGTASSENYAVRPTFYLNSTVFLYEGIGTSSNPYRLLG